MEPTEDRIHSVVRFIETVKPQLDHHVVPITDMFGPTITDPDLQCIVVSAETMKGGQIVNQERQKKVGGVSAYYFILCSSFNVWICVFNGLLNVSLNLGNDKSSIPVTCDWC
jgi:hypothetical protein